MKLIKKIPHYLVQVQFQDNEIQIYDMISKKVVASEPYNQKIVALRKVESQLYLALNDKDEIVSEISILIKLISKRSELQTEAGYILDLHMQSPSHGYYFGYYEMGEFKLTNDAKLAKIRSSLVQNCTKGRVTKSKNVYIGCRENDKYFLVKLNWKSNKDPKVLWKKAIPSAVMAMEIIEDRLFIGLKNGFLQLWDIQKDECIKNIGLFSSTISVLTTNGENITLASRAGDVARISKNGNIQWKTKLTQEEIVGIYEDIDYILVINKIGEQFHINFKSGKQLKHGFSNLKLGGNAGLSSSIIKYRERFVITGYGGIWAFRHRNSNNSIHQYMGDPLMRIIHQHPFGFYSGDDNGRVCFWGLGDIKIKVKNYEPPLNNYEEYKELISKSLGRPKRKKKRALKLMKTAPLRIEKLVASRSGRSLCYVDQSIMESLGIATGDIIEIIGKKRTAGIVVASFSDKGKNIIRIDGIQRINLGSTIGEFVKIQPTFAPPAREIELTSTKEIYDIKKQEDIIKVKLINKPIMAGDLIDIHRATSGPLRLLVLNIKPIDKVVIFTRDTRIVLHKNLKSKSKISSPTTPSKPPLHPPPTKPPGVPAMDPQGKEMFPDQIINSNFLNWDEMRNIRWIYCQKCNRKFTKEEFFTHSCKKKPSGLRIRRQRRLTAAVGDKIDPRLKGEVQSFLEWIKDSEGLSGYINYYLQQNNTTIISELSKIYAELRKIFGV